MQRVFESRLRIRVRYNECDPMSLAHHSAYPVWFEMGRTELLRARGIRYRDLEDLGSFLAVVELTIRYRKPARYDDELELTTRIERVTRVRIEHSYALRRDGLLLTEATTTLACIDRDGRLCGVPELLQALGPAAADPATRPA